MLVHGTEYERPFASYQIYGGNVFEQADQARGKDGASSKECCRRIDGGRINLVQDTRRSRQPCD